MCMMDVSYEVKKNSSKEVSGQQHESLKDCHED